MKTHQPSTDTESMIFDFLDTASELERRLDGALTIRGISFSEFKLLRVLSDAGGIGVPRTQLAQRVGLTPSAVTRALRPLEKLGYVKTARNDRDARQSLAIIAKAGIELQRDASGVVRDVLATLPISAATKQQINDLGRRLTEMRSVRA